MNPETDGERQVPKNREEEDSCIIFWGHYMWDDNDADGLTVTDRQEYHHEQQLMWYDEPPNFDFAEADGHMWVTKSHHTFNDVLSLDVAIYGDPELMILIFHHRTQ